MYDLILFDFDYTLGDSTDGIVDCINSGLAATGHPPRTREEIRPLVGLSLPETYRALTGRSFEDETKAFDAAFQRRADEVMTASATLYPHARELVERLKAEGKKLAVVTTKHRYRILEILDKFSLTEFDDVVGVENVRREKPDPEGVNMLAQKFCPERQKVLYVGDSLVDAETARRAGVPFAAVLTGTTRPEQFYPYAPVFIADDLFGLDALFFGKKCRWCRDGGLNETYHDNEWGIPLFDDRKQFEFLMLEAMQCGLSWTLMLKKREIFRACFDGFDYEKIARYTEEDVARILSFAGMIKSERKVRAVMQNARAYIALLAEFGSFSSFLFSFTGGKTVCYPAHAKTFVPKNALSDMVASELIKRGFRFLGSVTVYSHLQAAGVICDHETECFRYRNLTAKYPLEFREGL